MSNVIVDTSLAVKWVLHEPHFDEAVKLAAEWKQDRREVLVPAWFACEVANVFFQRVRQRTMTPFVAQASLAKVMSYVQTVDVGLAIGIRALDVAYALGQRASYDAYYLALAEHLDCELWTADERFWRAAQPAFPQIRWVGEISNGAVRSGSTAGDA